jgi:adenine-specific DNA-methyltransferase
MTCGRMIGPYPCCSILHANSLKVLPSLPSSSFDLIIADYPFFRTSDYQRLMDESAYQMARVAKPISNLVSINNTENWADFGHLFIPSWKFRNEIALIKNRPVACIGRIPSIHNSAKFYYREELLSKWNGPSGWNAGSNKDVVGYQTGMHQHSASKSLKLAKNWIAWMSDPGDLVLDVFAGSGTFCLAAAKLNRHYLGIEIRSNHISTFEARLEKVFRRKVMRDLETIKKQWDGLHPVDRGHSVMQLQKTMKMSEISSQLGKEASGLYLYIKLAKQPLDIQKKLRSGEIAMSTIARQKQPRLARTVAVPMTAKTRPSIRVAGVSSGNTLLQSIDEEIKKTDDRKAALLAIKEQAEALGSVN